jgi:hypothetical protein
MTYKTQCICQVPLWEEKLKLFPSFKHLCDCKGTKETEHNLSLDTYDGEFVPVIVWAEEEDSHTDIDDYQDDIYVKFTCECGDTIYFSEFGVSHVCSCGRVYELIGQVLKNDTHKDDAEYWDKIKTEKYMMFE